MTISFKPIVILSNRRKDGTYAVVIRVTFRGSTRRLPTTITATQQDLTRNGKIKNADISAKADRIVSQMRDAISDINPFELENRDVEYIVKYIKDRISGKKFRLDYFSFANDYLKSKSETTRGAYTTALNTFARYLGNDAIDINSIDRKLLIGFVEMVDNEPRMRWSQREGKIVPTSKPKPRGQSSRLLAKLENIYNAAKDKYNDEDSGYIVIPRSPFAHIRKDYPIPQGQKSIGRETMQRLLDYRTDNAVMRTAVDLYIISFATMGANLVDLYNARPFKGDWVYYRQKTTTRRADKAEMRVRIPEQIRPVLDRLQGNGEWWLNTAHRFASNKDFCTRRVNRCLEEWCKQNEVDVFTFYSARHTWATLARQECKVDKSTIDDCLGHIGSFRIADIYAEKAWDLMWETNDKVLALFTF